MQTLNIQSLIYCICYYRIINITNIKYNRVIIDLQQMYFVENLLNLLNCYICRIFSNID